MVFTKLPPRMTRCQVCLQMGLCLSRNSGNVKDSPSISLTLPITNNRNIHCSSAPPSSEYSMCLTSAPSILLILSGFSLTFLWSAVPNALNVMTHHGYLSKSSFRWLRFNSGFLELPGGVNNWSLGIRSPAIVGKSYRFSFCFLMKFDRSAGEAELIIWLTANSVYIRSL